MSFPVTWLPPPASDRLVGSEMYSIRVLLAFYNLFHVTSGQMTSLPVTWGPMTSFPITWVPPPASYTLVKSEMHIVRKFLTYYTHLKVTFSQMTSLAGQTGHLSDVTSFPVTWLPAPAVYSVVGSEMYSVREFLAFYSLF